MTGILDRSGHPERTGPQAYLSLGVVSRRTCIFFLSVLICVQELPARSQTVYDINNLKAFQKQLLRDHITDWISPDEATKLLIEKANPAVKASRDEGHRMGAVVVSFELTKAGEVQHATVMSGPKELQKPVLKAVEQYKYKPYLLNGTPSTVATSVSVTVYDY